MIYRISFNTKQTLFKIVPVFRTETVVFVFGNARAFRKIVCYRNSTDIFCKFALILCNVCFFEDSLCINDTILFQFAADQSLRAVCQGIDNIAHGVFNLSVYTRFDTLERGAGYIVLFKLRCHKRLAHYLAPARRRSIVHVLEIIIPYVGIVPTECQQESVVVCNGIGRVKYTGTLVPVCFAQVFVSRLCNRIALVVHYRILVHDGMCAYVVIYDAIGQSDEYRIFGICDSFNLNVVRTYICFVFNEESLFSLRKKRIIPGRDRIVFEICLASNHNSTGNSCTLVFGQKLIVVPECIQVLFN
ncbi:MAG: hypothetical protein BWY95_02313 [Bacteroidetes bacterium ADurb.BinA104]|nr:MAG: hypothetical protein BWY95_02313 [Bacteroidetes bacterium ADurb.BinA104]